MSDDRALWIRQSFQLALATAAIHFLQFVSGLTLWVRTGSVALFAFGLDAVVSAFAALLLAFRIRRSFATLGENWRSRTAAYGYLLASFVVAVLAAQQLWRQNWAERSHLGIALAAISMLIIPIVGSYMKTLAVELRSQPLKAASIFTFGNSYLSMVLLVCLLVNAGMDFRWGDAVGALVMFPFIAQKGLQILIDEGKQEYVED
jgi:divalent metal cation (Fe/Co/Zn/Cd) transporter